jgi:hypothetical protein|tara:strand:+ start:87 stop:485 length:399 start_codon:yes stop_codon:yes gene_type:complete
MSEEEKAEEVHEEPDKEMWSMDDLIGLTDKVQTEEIEYRKKTMAFQFCELAEKEEPKMSKNKFKNDEEQNEYFQKLGSERVIKMIEKANEKNPEGTTLTKEHWELLPTTLKYTIANKVIGLESNQAENFISG